jgi:hypothetical protein
MSLLRDRQIVAHYERVRRAYAELATMVRRNGEGHAA